MEEAIQSDPNNNSAGHLAKCPSDNDWVEARVRVVPEFWEWRTMEATL